VFIGLPILAGFLDGRLERMDRLGRKYRLRDYAMISGHQGRMVNGNFDKENALLRREMFDRNNLRIEIQFQPCPFR
jgi:hypothetical protein